MGDFLCLVAFAEEMRIRTVSDSEWGVNDFTPQVRRAVSPAERQPILRSATNFKFVNPLLASIRGFDYHLKESEFRYNNEI